MSVSPCAAEGSGPSSRLREMRPSCARATTSYVCLTRPQHTPYFHFLRSFALCSLPCLRPDIRPQPAFSWWRTRRPSIRALAGAPASWWWGWARGPDMARHSVTFFPRRPWCLPIFSPPRPPPRHTSCYTQTTYPSALRRSCSPRRRPSTRAGYIATCTATMPARRPASRRSLLCGAFLSLLGSLFSST